MRQAGWALVLKRALDLSVAGPGLVLASPVIALSAAAVRVTMGPPVFYHQQRPGRWGHPIRVTKLRTMSNCTGSDGKPLPDSGRLTPIGRFLRASSLDELPQLWSVLKGELSLVGPRPLLMQYLERYSPEQARRHEVLPGITGWAQVHGRNAIAWEEKFAHDVWYVDHWTPWLDVWILVLTVKKVLERQGVSSADHATMPEFMGHPDMAEARA